jgi:phage/conjugal plasmid C-4 type zinc finger TraR family protein
MDIFDRAQEKEQRDREAAIAAQRARAPFGESAKRCTRYGCGVPIPLARRLAVPGVKFCIDCQRVMERLRG